MRYFLAVLLFMSSGSYALYAADRPDSTGNGVKNIFDKLGNKELHSIEQRYGSLEQKITAYTTKSLKRLQKQEDKLRRKLASKDSLAARQLFGSAKEKYNSLQQQLKSPADQLNNSGVREYLPKLDSLQTTLKFLDKTGTGIPGLPTDKLQQLSALSGKLKSLETQLQTAADIKRFVKERRQQLKEQLEKYGLGKELKRLNKEAYYYQQQLAEYKSLLNNPDKMVEKALTLVRDNPVFKDFMSRNSQLAQIFRLPGSYTDPSQALQGLQTRADVQQLLGSQLGTGAGGTNPQQYLQQQVQQAQGELNKLKDKVNQFGGGSSDLEMPDFKPNNQKTKPFWKRLEYGFNIQSQKTNSLLPVTSDLALTVGYKLNDKATVGMGASYKLGWGKNISNIRFTSEGVGLRSYVDIKLKGSIWISGGYEYNYQQSFSKLEQLKDLDAWQKSGLIGLTKKYKIGKKNGNLQLLWDFLSYSQVPRTQALKFRIGYML